MEQMSHLDVLDLQKVTAQTGGEYQTVTSTISWSRCGGVSALSHNKCGWD
ncbi:class III lanthipeptide [Nocardia wallacei]|nr:class III lanthipeptide [Nocardia wallacei]